MKTLLFTESGAVQLIGDDGDTVIWSADDDPDFSDEFGDEFLDAEDAEDVAGYLMELGQLEDGEEFEVRESDLEEFGDGDGDEDGVIDGEFTDA